MPAGRVRRWGLPTASCPTTDYMMRELPVQHAQWKAQGRVLVHCSAAGGLGDYFKGLPAAFLLSLVLELAFVMECDTPQTLLGLPVKLPSYVQRFFIGPHFDWRGSGAVDHTAPVYRLTASAMRRDTRWPHDHGVRVQTQHSAPARRLYMYNIVKLTSLLGNWTHLGIDEFDGCLLRYLLAPSPALEVLTAKVAAASNQPLGASPQLGAGLLQLVAVHVRTGDSAFFSSNKAHGANSGGSSRWAWGASPLSITRLLRSARVLRAAFGFAAMCR